MPYYRTCLRCNAHLDPGEPCDCTDEDAATRISRNDVKTIERNRPITHTQYTRRFRFCQSEKGSNEL